MYSVVLMMAITTGGETPDMHRHGGGGCCGAVSSCGCYGGHGGGHHLLGGRHGHHGNGCGCYGGGYGYYGGCYGGGYGGMYYGGGCYGGGYGGWFGGERRPGEPIKMPSDKKPEDKKPDDKKIGEVGAPARITVSMPADARFTIDDYTSPARSETHVIVSGPLGADETRTYHLKAEVVRDGKVRTIEERVTVRSGEEAQVTLSLPTSVAAR